jgi:hypothetical protein
MTNPTSNFNWQMPTATDLVTDLPADFEVFGQAVDTSLADLKGGTTGQVLAKNSDTDMDFVWSNDAAGMTNPMTTTGDIIYSSSGSTPARLGIGTSGQVMGIAAGVPAWTTLSAAGKSFSLLNAGGTSLSGAATVTVSGISNQDTIYVIIIDASSDTAGSRILVRMNGVTSSTYGLAGSILTAQSSYSVGFLKRLGTTSESKIIVGDMSNNAGSQIGAYVRIDGCATSGIKMFQFAGTGNDSGGNNQEQWIGGGFLDTTTITSVSVVADVGNLDNGTMYVYGAS